MNEANDPMLPAVFIEAESQYVVGYPVLVAVIFRNETSDTDYLNLPDLGLMNPIDSVSVEFRPVDGGPQIQLGPKFDFREQHLFRTTLMAGEVKRRLIDLTHFGEPVKSGEYWMTLSLYNRPKESRTSSHVKVAFIEPSSAEHSEGKRLRQLGLAPNDRDFGSWKPFLARNWNTVSVSEGIGVQASKQLALYLFLHKACYGPESLSNLGLEMLENLRGPVLSCESALLEYELLCARGNKVEGSAVRPRALQTWPGLKDRFTQIDNGEGLLSLLRKGYGVERNAPLPEGNLPYTH